MSIVIELLRNVAALLFLAAARATGRRVGIVLVYHRVEEVQGDPAHELVPALSARRFDAQLRHLARHYHAVAAGGIQAAAAMRRRGQRFPFAVTFDDDLASHFEMAAPLLRRRGVPATFFLCGACLHASSPFWWERLQRVADAGKLDLVERELAALGAEPPRRKSRLHGVAAAVEEMRPAEREKLVTRVAGLDERASDDALPAHGIAALVAAGFAVGFHTRRHDRLPALDDAALARALREGRDELEQLAGAPLEAIAYPHGRADERVADAAREAGFTFGFTGRPIAVTPASDPLLLGRFEPPFGSPGAFALYLARIVLSA